ncbi:MULTISPECIES: hypothetical protein [Pseudomonadaceae]|uniref:Lipoprotein n=2 Tax=Ectopseudomonas TaxID=3236654 RepID=A4XND5_ECTM1|nr:MULTISPECIES: hypothetical protein [Pseudomonas]ARS46888.1 hypothetical protein PSMEN_00280 [Pseudomonas mendocina]ATH79841.1 hypothetical protein CO724_01200 [Pseudomonas mendocina]MBA4244031.1 hypothetical protein [Pseudomonas sp.]MBF8164007.1 hypothetical protein [Pseudomonas mendocina]MDH0096681.1 hypothetical protein [Pseudomonas sp. GD04158]
MFRSMLMLLAALALGGCIESETPLVEERRLLLSGEDFSAYDAPDGGRYEKLVTYAARSIDLSFESEGSDWFYLYSGVSLYPRASDALMTSYAETFGASFGLRGSGLVEQELPLQTKLAARASLKLLTQDGEPVGNLFYATVGNKSMFTIFTGVYFERAEDFEAFVAPKLLALRQYKHDDPLLTWAGRTLGFDE